MRNNYQKMANYILPKKIKSLLLRYSLTYVEDRRAKPRKIIFVKDEKGREYCLKFGLERKYRGRLRTEIRKVNSLFPAIQNLKFKTLVIPKIIKISDSRSFFPWILFKDYGNVFPWIERKEFKKFLGGKAVPLNLVPKIISLLSDLRSINISFPRCIKKRNLRCWLESFPVKLKKVKRFFPEKDFKRKIELIIGSNLKVFEKSQVMLNGGDFYPRNFISYRNKIVLIDWESALVEPLEGLVAYLWMLMFGNPRWQRELIRTAGENFKINRKVFQLMLLTKAFDETYLWKEVDSKNDSLKTAREKMISYVYLVLTEKGIKNILSGN